MRRGCAWAFGLLVGCGPSLGSDTSFGEGDGGTAIGEDSADSGGLDSWNPVTDSGGGTTGANTGVVDDSTSGPSATTSPGETGGSDSDGSDGADATSSAVEDSGQSTGAPDNAPDHVADCMLDIHIEPVIGQPELHVIGVYEASGDHSTVGSSIGMVHASTWRWTSSSKHAPCSSRSDTRCSRR